MKLQSPQARAAFAGFIPSIIRREKTYSTFGGAQHHHPTSYRWAGTPVVDTFYGRKSKPGPLAGMTRGGDDSEAYFGALGGSVVLPSARMYGGDR